MKLFKWLHFQWYYQWGDLFSKLCDPIFGDGEEETTLRYKLGSWVWNKYQDWMAQSITLNDKYGFTYWEHVKE